MPKKLRSPDEIIVNGIPLSKILEEHRQWIESNGKSGTRANLRSAKLEDANLPKVNLKKADLYGINLLRANLQEANLQEADLQKADLLGAKLNDVELQEADLREAELYGCHFPWANLQGASLQKANLQDANLWGANLLGADLRETNLFESVLQMSNLQKANLKGANLNETNLQGADLRWANLQEAKLDGAKLQDANLSDANLGDASLFRADLQSANLQNADLQNVNLRLANFKRANLWKAILKGVNFKEADLQRAILESCNICSSDFTYSDLRLANLINADITGSRIYATATANWRIEDIRCDYIFTDKDGKKRYPKDRNFEKGEFEKLYRSIPTVEYVFEKGMNWFDPILMNYVATKIDQEKPELGIELLSFEKRGIFPKATFSIASESVSAGALEEIKKGYEKALEEAHNQIDFLQNLVKELSLKPRVFIPGSVGRDLNIAYDNAQVKTINIGEVKINIEKIIETIEAEPAASFKGKGKGKKHVLDILKGIISGLTVENAPAALEKVTELVNTLGPQLVDKIQPLLDMLKSFV